MINVVCGIRSTGRICTDLATVLEKMGHEIKIAYGREDVPEQYKKYAVRICSDKSVTMHGINARLFDGSGWGSKAATVKFVNWIKEFNPDVIHLHNLHGYYLNVEVLFDYLRTYDKRIIWTLHDCWAFTGHAAYCEWPYCTRWTIGCYECPKIRDYPKSYLDQSKKNWKRKKTLFTNIPNLTLVTPSNWLKLLVQKSFLSCYPTVVIHNGIDLSKFFPIESDIKKRLNLETKKIILGVAAVWDDRKGLKDFIKLSELLSDDYRIVLVGISQDQKKLLPKSIVTIKKTNSTTELAELYSASDVYINPTYEDNYPTTNLEAIACGTPVISYDTGGSPESANLYGFTVPKGQVDKIVEKIYKLDVIENIQDSLLQKIDIKTMIENYLMIINAKDH